MVLKCHHLLGLCEGILAMIYPRKMVKYGQSSVNLLSVWVQRHRERYQMTKSLNLIYVENDIY